MSAAVATITLWEQWHAHRDVCTHCTSATRLPFTDASKLCLEGGVLYTKWQKALEEAEHRDDADSDRGRE